MRSNKTKGGFRCAKYSVCIAVMGAVEFYLLMFRGSSYFIRWRGLPKL